MDLSEKTPQPHGKYPPVTALPARHYDQCDDTCTVDCGHCKGAVKPKRTPKHLARPTVKSMLAERRVARERGQALLTGRVYPSAPGKHAAEVTA